MKSQQALKNIPATRSDAAAAPALKKSDRTRAAILEAARALFAERGYAATTVRDVAAAAAVDPALVIRYFGSKDDLFVRATDFELKLPQAKPSKGRTEGELLVRHFFEVWEQGPSASGMAILLRSAATNEDAAAKMREMFAQQVLPMVARTGKRSTAPLRASLIATQMLGLALCRYVLRIPGVADAAPEELVAAIAPTIQRYLTGDG
jgi:AcrR family transcriptional regulator